MPVHRRGFTLIELLIVVTILGIIGALAFPTVSSSMADSRLRDAMNEFRFSLAEARARATERNVAVVVVITAGAPTGGTFTLWESLTRDCSLVDTGVQAPLLGPFDLGASLRFRETGLSAIDQCGAAAGATVDLCFRPDGGVYNRPAITPLAGPMDFHFTRYADGSPAGVDRILRLNFNGIPRIVR